MIYRALLLTSLSRAASSLTLPTTAVKDLHRHVSRGIGVLAIFTASPLTSNAIEVIKIDADIPAMVQIAKDNKELVLKIAKQAASAVHISKFPTNLVEFARDAAAGDAFVEINGYPIDISLLSGKGAIDVSLSTENGDLSLTISSTYLPKLPFLSKRVVPLPTNAGVVEVEEGPRISLLEQPFFLDPLQKGWTNLQVLGTTTLALGTAYATSYAYYIKSGEDEEKAAAEKKREFARKAAEAKKAAKALVPKPVTFKVKAVVGKPEEAAVEKRPSRTWYHLLKLIWKGRKYEIGSSGKSK